MKSHRVIYFKFKVDVVLNLYHNKSGVAADTSGHQLAQQFLMCTSLTSLKEDSMYFFTTPVAHKMNKIRVFKLFELQGFQKLPPLSKEVKRAAHKMSKLCLFGSANFFSPSERLTK